MRALVWIADQHCSPESEAAGRGGTLQDVLPGAGAARIQRNGSAIDVQLAFVVASESKSIITSTDEPSFSFALSSRSSVCGLDSNFPTKLIRVMDIDFGFFGLIWSLGLDQLLHGGWQLLFLLAHVPPEKEKYENRTISTL